MHAAFYPVFCDFVIVQLVEPLLYDHHQNHIGVVVESIRGMVAREGFIYVALLQ